MPLVNGDARGGQVPLLREQKPLDHNKALDVLEQEYHSRDGLDIQTLLDSTKNGALTYNDFLILPGYIGQSRSLYMEIFEVVSDIPDQASLLLRLPSILQSPSAYRSRRLYCLLRWIP